jgi:hypothetical protein
VVRGGSLMHGVGLLRVSHTPVTVDCEEYVVFVDGWLSPRTFGSWREAYVHFLECQLEHKKRPRARLCSSVHRRTGRRPGETAYRKALKTQEEADAAE